MWNIISQARVFFQTMFDFFFFITPCHPELVSGSHFFFKKILIFLFFITSLFLLFHKNYYHFTKGKEPAQSPKPAVSFPLNPFHLGHGLGCYPKNPPTSKWVALATNKSVWQKQIRMASNYSVTFFEKIETSPLSRYFTSPLSVRTISFASSLISSTKQ